MKRINLLVFAAAFLVNLSAIAQINTPAMQLLQFDDEGNTFTLMAPKGAKVKKHSWGSIEITSGKKFQLDIWVSSFRTNIAEVKKSHEENDINKLKKYLIDTPKGILYQSDLWGETQFHLYTYKDIGELTVKCEDLKDGTAYSEQQARVMFAACESIQKK